MADLPDMPGVVKLRRKPKSGKEMAAEIEAQSSDPEEGGAAPPEAVDKQNAARKGRGKQSAAADGAASSASRAASPRADLPPAVRWSSWACSRRLGSTVRARLGLPRKRTGWTP